MQVVMTWYVAENLLGTIPKL